MWFQKGLLQAGSLFIVHIHRGPQADQAVTILDITSSHGRREKSLGNLGAAINSLAPKWHRMFSTISLARTV